MACSAVRSPLLRNSTVRHYAAAAAACQASPSSAVESEVLKNNIIIAAAQQNHPLSQVSIVFRAGPRNETYNTQGVCHYLRIMSGLATKKYSHFGITKNVQHVGGTITTTVDRETIAYTLLVTRNHLETTLPYLAQVATKQLFKPWEMADEAYRMYYELLTIPENTRLIELLHKAAYHSGLGYSLYCPKHEYGKINSETLQHFVNTWFSNSRCAVVGTGVSKETLSNFAEDLELDSGCDAADAPSKFVAGEMRKEIDSELAFVAVAVEGACLKNEKEALACAILQRAAGSGPRVKWGSSPAPLYSRVANAAGTTPFAVSGLNVSYSDSGLFGFVLSAPGNIAGSLMKCAYEWMKNPKLSDEDINRGKATLKAEVYSVGEHCCLLADELAQQALIRGKVTDISTIASEIDNVCASDVQAMASKLASKPIAVAALGNLETVPIKDQLK